jgi:hypothetical protein
MVALVGRAWDDLILQIADDLRTGVLAMARTQRAIREFYMTMYRDLAAFEQCYREMLDTCGKVYMAYVERKITITSSMIPTWSNCMHYELNYEILVSLQRWHETFPIERMQYVTLGPSATKYLRG